MNTFLITLLNMSLTASYTVLAVLLARFLLKKAPKWVICALWSLVALRLVCPFTIESVLSIIPKADPIPTNIVYDTIPAIDSGIPIVNNVVNPFISHTFAPNFGDSVNPLQVVLFIGGILWILGMACILFYATVGYLRLSRSLYERIPLQDNIYLCDAIDIPFILGMIKPKIFLPSYLDQSTMDCVIAHERAHIKRKDHLWKPLGFLLLTVYWFNPLLWVAYKLFCKDMEMACDQKVIGTMSTEEIKTYSSALLSCGTVHRTLGVTPLAFGETGVKNRIKSVLNYKKPAFWMVLTALVVSIAVGVCFLTDPIPQEHAEPSQPVDQETLSPPGTDGTEVDFSVDETSPIVFRAGEDITSPGVLDAGHIEFLKVYKDESHGEMILLTLTDNGKTLFAQATEENIGKTISVWLYDSLILSPTVAAPITNGKVVLTNSTTDQAVFENLLTAFYQTKHPNAAQRETKKIVKQFNEAVTAFINNPVHHRDIGDWQRETGEIIQLDDGKYYQSYVASNADERYVWVSNQEADIGEAEWDFVFIGTANNYSAKNIPTAFLKQNAAAEQEYAELLAEKRDGYELLVRAPENPKTLTQEQIEKIFYVDLPEHYRITDYKFAIDRNVHNAPMYALHILMEEEDVNQMLSSPKMEAYQEMPINKAVYVETNNLSRWFTHLEQLHFLTEQGIETPKHMDQTELYVMKEPVDGKREVLLRFNYDDQYVAYMNNQ